MTTFLAAGRYDAITKIIRDAAASIEDNVAAHLIELLTTPQLEAAAKVGPGRTMLDVCYDAIITGSVTDFERLQGDRILAARVTGSDNGVPGDALQTPPSSPSPQLELHGDHRRRPGFFDVRVAGPDGSSRPGR